MTIKIMKIFMKTYSDQIEGKSKIKPSHQTKNKNPQTLIWKKFKTDMICIIQLPLAPYMDKKTLTRRTHHIPLAFPIV
jgi:hypothetical protein